MQLHNLKIKEVGIKVEGKISPKLLFIRQEKTARAKNTETAVQGSSKSKRAPGRPPRGQSPQPERGAPSWHLGGLIITPIISELILGGASPLSLKVSNSDNKSR